MISPIQVLVCQEIIKKLQENNQYGAAVKCGLPVQDIVKSTVDKYINQGLRGHKLRSEVRNEYGVSILLILQFIWIILKIIDLIKELYDENTGQYRERS